MQALTRFILLCTIFGFTLTEETTNTNGTRNGRHFLGIFGFIQGFKLGQEYGLQLAPYLYSPSLYILPSPVINQQQSVSVQKAVADENFQEMGQHVQKFTPTQNGHLTKVVHGNSSNQHLTQVEVITPVSKTIKREAKPNTNFRNTDDDGNNITTDTFSAADATTTTDKLLEENITSTEYQSIPSTVSDGSDSTITENSPTGDTNLDSNNTTETAAEIISTTSEVNTVSQTTTKEPGIYPEANNRIEGIDKLYITTASPTLTNELTLPSRKDLWEGFTFTKKLFSNSVGGFKPLAGLYYDGFLPKSIG